MEWQLTVFDNVAEVIGPTENKPFELMGPHVPINVTQSLTIVLEIEWGCFKDTRCRRWLVEQRHLEHRPPSPCASVICPHSDHPEEGESAFPP